MRGPECTVAAPARGPIRAPSISTTSVCIVIGTGYIGTEICEEADSAATPARPISSGRSRVWVLARVWASFMGRASYPVGKEAELWDAAGDGSSSSADTSCQRRNTK